MVTHRTVTLHPWNQCKASDALRSFVLVLWMQRQCPVGKPLQRNVIYIQRNVIYIQHNVIYIQRNVIYIQRNVIYIQRNVIYIQRNVIYI